jgi:hypothetical protein
MRFDEYGPSEPGMRRGTTLTEISAYGPIAMAGSQDEWLFGTDLHLYERRRSEHFAWGLWTRERTDIEVPGGFRVKAQTSFLFGLLRWPTDAYVDAPSGELPAAW